MSDVDESSCRGIVGTTGRQCGANSTPLCGNHDTFSDRQRVDSYEGELNPELRDELVDLGLEGHFAYALAVAADDVEDLWRILTGAKDVDVGVTLTADELAWRAPDVAEHDELDVDDHPLADKRCVALIEDGSYGKGYRCKSQRYGLGLLCGGHRNADDPEIELESTGYLDELETLYAAGDEYHVLEQRGDDVVVVTPDWFVERRERSWFVDPETADDFERASELEDDQEGEDPLERLYESSDQESETTVEPTSVSHEDVDEQVVEAIGELQKDEQNDESDQETRVRRLINSEDQELLEIVRDRVEGKLERDTELQYTADVLEEKIPLRVAAGGKAIIAAYLQGHGISRAEIADVLDVSEQSISQYMSDLRAGRR